MPELPEVETIRKQLQSRIAGKTIKHVEVLYPKVVHGTLSVPKNHAKRGGSTADFVRALKGRKVCKVGRQGKLILIRLNGNETLVVHLKMTGRLLLNGEFTKSTEVIFTFTDSTVLNYDDLRRFGYMKIVPTREEARVVQKEQLGIDFFDRAHTAEKFCELIASRGGSQIKPLLLDQSLIAGVGNIYAQEACFMAKIDPLRKAGNLNERELRALYQALRSIMLRAIKGGGTSADDYRDALGKMGKFAPHLKVYGREGKPCPRCKTTLVKKFIGGRGTVFCSKCQG